jgi:hypothetical protein
MDFLNIALLKEPSNWLKVWLMVFIGAIAFDIVARSIRIKSEGNS